MNIGVVIQARRSSSRLPDKILKELPRNSGVSVLGNVILRAKKAFPMIIVATSENHDDDLTEKEALSYGAFVYRGSLEDVLSRYVGAVKKFNLDYVIRITSDCPCIDPIIIKNITDILTHSHYDYVSNVENRVFPHGLDTEAFTKEALFQADRDEKRQEIREHVTYHIRLSDNFKKFNYQDTLGLSKRPDIRITLDTSEDYTALSAIFSLLPKDFSLKEIIKTYDIYPWLSEINNKSYQKLPFTDIQEELKEASKLLRLYGMKNASKIIDKNS